MGNCWGTKISSHNVSPASPSSAGTYVCKTRRRTKGGRSDSQRIAAFQFQEQPCLRRVVHAQFQSRNPSQRGRDPAVRQREELHLQRAEDLHPELPPRQRPRRGRLRLRVQRVDRRQHLQFAPTRPGTAVKKLNQQGFQGHREWLAEVNYLGQLSHPNLVKLVGYCLEDEQRLLVYEFMPRGSLENHLFRRGSHFQPLSWNLRMKVALGAAKGLAFLHSDKAKVIYRDFKTSNVLLDSNYNAKLSDFGLAKDGPTGDKSHVSTRVMGTYGYAAPEYLATGHLTAKSDVYSFGVVLLELLSGRRAVDKNRPSSEHNLVDWARPYLSSKRRLFRILDARLGGQYSLSGAHRVAALALQCLSGDSRNRPTMDQVVASLQQLADAVDDGHLLVLGSSGHRSSRSRRYPNSPPDVYHQVVALNLNLNAPGAKSAAYRRPTTMRRRLSASPLPEL